MQCEWQAPVLLSGAHPAIADPWDFAVSADEDAVMAVLIETVGPAYRLPGAAMAILPDRRYAGAITSGCIEADLILNADDIRATSGVRVLRYGEGSPFKDIQLPCGGGIDVMLFRLQDRNILEQLTKVRKLRQPVSLVIGREGRLSLGIYKKTARNFDSFSLGFEPPLRFVTFGAGPEASIFAGLVEGLGYGQTLISHDATTVACTRASGNTSRELSHLSQLNDVEVDSRTAAVLFYHDHDYEPEIIRRMLATPAFYIGAQGSRATQRSRLKRLEEAGVHQSELQRVRGPIGLIPSSRDPRALAVSVLAEVLSIVANSADLSTPSKVGLFS
ncbi:MULTISPECIES: XdhC family protein [Rhizobium]|nr:MULTISPECIES: XdhC family protein [Rhizobium]ARM90980.1 xanthine dehydrogenase accessory protein XdhC 2 [Rhizobium sp. CIAT894]MDF9821566.1 xanthine dehydrogenase accessory factor [Rhizobium leguminosarum]